MRHFGNAVGHLHCGSGDQSQMGRTEEETDRDGSEEEGMSIVVEEESDNQSDQSHSDSSLDSDDTGYGSF